MTPANGDNAVAMPAPAAKASARRKASRRSLSYPDMRSVATHHSASSAMTVTMLIAVLERVSG